MSALVGAALLMFLGCKKDDRGDGAGTTTGTAAGTAAGTSAGTATGSGLGTAAGSSISSPEQDALMLLEATTDSLHHMDQMFQADWPVFVERVERLDEEFADLVVTLEHHRMANPQAVAAVKTLKDGGSPGLALCKKNLNKPAGRIPGADAMFGDFVGADRFQLDRPDDKVLLWIFGKASNEPETFTLIACRDHTNYEEPFDNTGKHRALRVFGSTRGSTTSITLNGWKPGVDAGRVKVTKQLVFQNKRLNCGVELQQ